MQVFVHSGKLYNLKSHKQIQLKDDSICLCAEVQTPKSIVERT